MRYASFSVCQAYKHQQIFMWRAIMIFYILFIWFIVHSCATVTIAFDMFLQSEKRMKIALLSVIIFFASNY